MIKINYIRVFTDKTPTSEGSFFDFDLMVTLFFEGKSVELCLQPVATDGSHNDYTTWWLAPDDEEDFSLYLETLGKEDPYDCIKGFMDDFDSLYCKAGDIFEDLVKDNASRQTIIDHLETSYKSSVDFW